MQSIGIRYSLCRTVVLTAVLGTLTASDSQAQIGWGDNSYATSYYAQDERWTGSGRLGSATCNSGWALGVNGRDTDAGVIIQQIAPNSAAARANLVPGDVIVCVGGDQVGRVGRQLFDVEEKVKQHADSRGRVLLLVNSRSAGALRPVTVQLQDQGAGLSGSLSIQGNRLPANAMVTIRLENVSRPHYTIRNGETSFPVDGYGVGEIPFQLNYDPRYISNTDVYRLRAFVMSSGRVIFDTVRPPLVLTQGNPATVRLLLRPSSYTAEQPVQYTSVGYTPVVQYEQDINSAYQQYLGRMPSSMEMAAWSNLGDISERLERISLELIATQEYYNRVGGDNRLWFQQAFTEVIGHQPSASETELWMRRFAELRYSRTELLNQLFMQARR